MTPSTEDEIGKLLQKVVDYPEAVKVWKEDLVALINRVRLDSATKAINCQHVNQYSMDSLPPQVNCTDCGASLTNTGGQK